MTGVRRAVSAFFRCVAAVTLLAVPAVLPAQPGVPATPGLDFSGILFGSFQYHTGPGAAHTSKFDLDRAYLTFRMPAGDKVGVRITADLSPQQSGTGYVFRVKYAYLQHDFGTSKRGYAAWVRVGVLQTVKIEHEETFWPRWLGTVGNERFGYFSSADVGASALLAFPRQRGELYAVISNGAGYTRPETDRFKSYAARLTLTPFAEKGRGPFKNLAISPWADLNAAASTFVSGGAGQIGPVGDGLARHRYGVFTGIRDPRLVVGLDASRRRDGTEGGANTAAAPRTVRDVPGELYSAFAVVRPFQLADSANRNPLALVARYDRVKPDRSLSGSGHFLDLGVLVEISKQSSLAFSYLETLPSNGAAIAPLKVFEARFMASF